MSSTPELRREIDFAIADDLLCWRELLNSAELGEIYPTDSEALARSYARQMLLKDDV